MLDDVPVESISIANHQLVGIGGDTVSVMRPRTVMTKDEALVHAAWLCVLADPLGDRFAEIMQRVRNT